jgi:hypothetical protein
MIMKKFVSPILVEINGQHKNVYVRVTYDHKTNLDMSVSPMIMKQFFGVNAKAQASANFKQNSRGCKGANVLL